MSSSKNRPFRKDEVEDYERRRYRGLDQRVVHNREMRILERIFRGVKGGGPLSVLDAPCGFGRFTKFLLERSAFLAATDLSPAMVERTASRESGAVRPRGVVADLKRGLPFEPGSFSLVFSMRFFHHLHESGDRRAVLAEFGRVSRRWAVVSFYRLNPLHRFQRWVRAGVMEVILGTLAQDLKERGGLDVRECFIDGTFVVAKKGALGWERPSGAKVRSSWQWQTALVFLSPYASQVLARMK